MDQFNRFLVGCCLVIMFVSFFLSRIPIAYMICSLLQYVLIVLAFIRMLSKNFDRRYRENMAFLKWWNPIMVKVNGLRRDAGMRKMYHIYTCKSCGQKIRIPRGKGRIIVTCPKCRFEFEKKA